MTTVIPMAEKLNPSPLDSIINAPTQDLREVQSIPVKYFENPRNIIEYQQLARTGKPENWLIASLNGGNLPELPEKMQKRITYTGEATDAVGTSIMHSAHEMTRLANSYDISSPESYEPHEIFYAKHQYRQRENYIIKHNLDNAVDQGLIDETTLTVAPFDGARALGEVIENHPVKTALLTGNFKRIKQEDEDTLVAISGLEIEGKVAEKVRSIAWIDDCLASGVTAKSAMEMLRGVSETFVIVVTLANEESSTELIRYGMEELGYKDVRVIAAKKNTRLDSSHYLLTAAPDIHGNDQYEVGDMGEWGRPVAWEEKHWWGHNKKAAKVKKVGDLQSAA